MNMAAHWFWLMALVPLSVMQSMYTSRALRRNALYWASFRHCWRYSFVVLWMGSTILIRNGSGMYSIVFPSI